MGNNSKCPGTESRNSSSGTDRSSLSATPDIVRSMPTVPTLCRFCRQGELYCRCLAEPDEPDYYDVYTARQEAFYSELYGEPIELFPQSGESNYNATVMMGSTSTKEQITEFRDQNPSWGYAVDSQPDDSYGAADQSDSDLGNFFQRPLKIFDVDWATTNSNFGTTFNPWTLFMENPRVANRIANFNNVRCKLHLKFVINGNGFHYGRALVSYTPLQSLDNTTPTRAFIAQDIIGASQKPHIYLDPTSSLGGEMVLPFFWYRNALSVPNADWQDMGAIDITAINQLKHANGATDQVRITVFAWAEDMVLSTPTNRNPITLDPQSGMMGGDEYGKKVSGPATALAKAAGALTSVPGIGLYARASQLALSAVADVASLFGYCRPAQDAPIVPYRPAYVGNMANTNVPDSTTKLTTDLKQEVTIDPRTTGLSDVDEMSIKSIVTRESFLTKVDWAITDSAGDRLATFGVTPMNWDEFSSGNNTEYHMTPACHLGSLFENWKGTMKYRFQIVASNFHKGRIQVQYDPYDSFKNEFNVAYNRVIDIAEEKDFTIEVGWGIPYTYGEVMNPGISGLNFRRDGTVLPFPANAQNFYNGQISLWVLNDLTVPNSEVNNDIQINVFVSCGDDFEFINPTDEIVSAFTWFPDPEPPALNATQEEKPKLEPQSGEEPLVAPDHDDTDNPSRPVTEAPDMKVSGDSDPTNPLGMVCFGEAITSVRALMKRYTLYNFGSMLFTGGDTNQLYRRVDTNFPRPRGYAPNGVNSAIIYPYNYVNQTILGWFAPVYQGWRGGLRRKIVALKPNTVGGSNFRGWMQARRIARPANSFSETATQVVLTDTNSEIVKTISNLPVGFSGAHATALAVNPVLEIELPYHSDYRFHPTRPLEPNANPAIQFENSFELLMLDEVTLEEGGSPYIEYVAAGDDIGMYFYTNVPVCYYFPTNPA